MEISPPCEVIGRNSKASEVASMTDELVLFAEERPGSVSAHQVQGSVEVCDGGLCFVGGERQPCGVSQENSPHLSLHRIKTA